MTVYATTIYGKMIVWERVQAWRLEEGHIRVWFTNGRVLVERVPPQYVGFWSVR